MALKVALRYFKNGTIKRNLMDAKEEKRIKQIYEREIISTNL